MSDDEEPTMEALGLKLGQNRSNPFLANEKVNPPKRKAVGREKDVSESEHIRLSEQAEQREKTIIREKKRDDYKRGNYKGERKQ